MKPRKIIHIDMDCFYAAVELKFRPDLKGRPLAVGGSAEGRGVLTTANYEARRFGVKSAMTARQALRLCPDLILVPVDFSKYRTESRKVREIFERYTTKIEPLSLDEAYLDVTDSAIEAGSATRIAERIRREIREELELSASAGVAPNKFLAKVASDMNKPDGLTVVRPEQVAEFVRTLPVTRIWGVGRVTAERMHRMGIKTCADLQGYSVTQLIEKFGQFGTSLYDYARGIDNREVVTERERKSLSVEETFRVDKRSPDELRREMKAVYRDFAERFQRFIERSTDEESLARSLVVKLKFSDFKQKVRERRWERAECPSEADFISLLDEALQGETRAVRLLGIGVRFHDGGPGRDRGPQLRLG
ncbi:MAG: DNA polymerase IV [Bdellovibrionaceae bacterium]|nr:DNA polymerase IV [Pseudobdellovibrionaceae bacterium]